MRRFLIIAALGLAALQGFGEASAQVRMQTYVPRVTAPTNAPIVRAPSVKAPSVKILPKIIPPSVAMNSALRMVPRAKAVSVKLKGPVYIVKVKDGSKLRLLRVNAANGAVMP